MYNFRLSIPELKQTRQACRSANSGAPALCKRPVSRHQQILFIGICATFLLLPSSEFTSKAQQPTASPASKVLASSLGVIAGSGASVDDVVLTGDVKVWTKGVPIEGTVRLVSNSSGMTRVEFTLPSGGQIETRRVLDKSQSGEMQIGSAAMTTTSLHNLLIDPAWFFPEHLVSRMIVSTRPIISLPTIQMDGKTVNGIENYMVSASASHSDALRQMSDLKVFFDVETQLPVELQYNNHANESLLKIIPTRIAYGDYRVVQNHKVPFHIQRFEKGVLHDDITITAAAFNTGTSSSEYSLK